MIPRKLAISIAAVAAALTLAAAALDAQRHTYRRTADWGQLPAGTTWGEVTSVDIAPDGTVFVLSRCFAKDNNGCIGRDDQPAILKFDKSGKLLKSWGQGMFVFPHGAFLDQEGNYWATDSRGAAGKGHQVFKFSGDGKLLMTLGKPGVAGATHDTFNAPSDVLVAPNGNIFVADGHGGNTNDRIVVFNKDGQYIKEWGKKGKGPGEFDVPHRLAMDSAGRLFVADRSNNRVQVFDQDGKYLLEWKQFGSPSGLFIDKNDMLYVADNSPDERNPPYRSGIRIGSVKDGRVTGFILESVEVNGLEAVAVDNVGNVYGGYTNTLNFRRWVKKPTS